MNNAHSRQAASFCAPLQRRLQARGTATLGATLLELIVTMALIGIMLIIGIPSISRLSARARLDAAASEVSAILRRSHHEARLNGHNVGLKFFPAEEGRSTYALFEDGDGDGIRSADIRTGVDPQRTPRRPLQHLGQDIRFGIPLDPRGRPPKAPNSRRRLTNVEDPIRFNRSDIASFSARGTATPGTVYLTDGRHAFAVRVRNQAGKVQVLRYDPLQEIWK